MDKSFVITGNVSYDHEGTTTHVVAVRFCSEEAIISEVQELNSKIVVDDYVNRYFEYTEVPQIGYVDIHIPMNDRELQKVAFKSILSVDYIKNRQEYFFNNKRMMGVTFKDYFIESVQDSPSHDLLTKEDLSTIYDKFVEENAISIMSNI